MKPADCLYLAKKSLAHFKVRCFLICLCIATGILISTLNLYHTSKCIDELVRSLEGMGSQLIAIYLQDNTVTLQNLSFLSHYFERISYEVSDYSHKIRYLRKDKEVIVKGVTPMYKIVHSVRIRDGRFFTSGDIRGKRKVCLISEGVASELKIKVGKIIRLGDTLLRVIGVINEEELRSSGGGSAFLFIPFSTYNVVIGSYESKEVEIIISTKGSVEALIKQVDRILKCRFSAKDKGPHQQATFNNEQFWVSRAEGLTEMIKKEQGIGKMMTLGIWVITLILAGSGIVNLIMLSVRQRYKEIGIMRACGAKQKDIFYLFLIEGFLLEFYGICFGGGIGALYVGLIGGCRFDIFLEALLWSGIICIPLGLCGYYPASFAAKVSPCEAIRVSA